MSITHGLRSTVFVWGFMLMSTSSEVSAQARARFWLHCSASGVATGGFCTQLKQDVERIAKIRVGLGAGPDGATGILVSAVQTDAQTASVTLSGGLFAVGKLHVSQRQELQISVTDAKFGPHSALTLVYPIITMLQQIHTGTGLLPEK